MRRIRPLPGWIIGARIAPGTTSALDVTALQLADKTKRPELLLVLDVSPLDHERKPVDVFHVGEVLCYRGYLRYCQTLNHISRQDIRVRQDDVFAIQMRDIIGHIDPDEPGFDVYGAFGECSREHLRAEIARIRHEVGGAYDLPEAV
jgi:hypothetical protein